MCILFLLIQNGHCHIESIQINFNSHKSLQYIKKHITNTFKFGLILYNSLSKTIFTLQ